MVDIVGKVEVNMIKFFFWEVICIRKDMYICFYFLE